MLPTTVWAVAMAAALAMLFAGAAAEDGPPIGMPNCTTKCGDIDVPYPFGMGRPECYMPEFEVSCDKKRKQLRLLRGDLQVSYIDTSNERTLRVFYTGDINMSRSGSGALDGDGTFLGGLTEDGPFRLTQVNKLIVMGCNVQATVRDGRNRTVNGCSSFCEEPLLDGMGICLSEVLVPSSSWQVQVRWTGWDRSFDQQWLPRVFVTSDASSWLTDSVYLELLETKSTPSMGTTQFSVDLEWEIMPNGSSDCSSVCRSEHSAPDTMTRMTTSGACMCLCIDGYYGNAYVPGGCAEFDGCKPGKEGDYGCYGSCVKPTGGGPYRCQCPPGKHGNPGISGGCVDSTVATGLVTVGDCVRKCGGVEVPYPFGITLGPPKCYLPGFNLTCDKSGGPQRLLLGDNGEFRVDSISLDTSTLHVFHSGAFLNVTDESPDASNDFFSQAFPDPGKAPYSLSPSNELILTGCKAQAKLGGDGDPAPILSGCSTFCSDNTSHDAVDAYCSGEQCCQARISTSRAGMPKWLSFTWLDSRKANDSWNAHVFVAQQGWFNRRRTPMEEVPILLRWEILHSMPQSAASKHIICSAGDRGFTCRCQEGYHGNPYVTGGCTGHRLTLGMCIVIGVATVACLILSAMFAVFVNKKIQHRRAKMLKRKFYEKNRGKLLEQLVSQRADIAERMIVTLEELEKATNNFDKARELGGGGNGTVYKGILSDLHVVAIKKPKKVVQKNIDEFINEVAILSQINHRNIVKLYGCCLETEVPMLVYEFISNGTLYDHLHVNGPISLSWDDRLRIATEAAGCLSFLHSTASVPIIHRDIKAVNILMDDSLTPKVADFGASRYAPIDGSGVTTMVQGTIGYMDPICIYTGRITEKSDVYSFGVLLVELLTRKKPYLYLSIEGAGLAADFATFFAEGNLSQILDPQVMEEGGSKVEKVAALVVECIKLRAEDRPTMKQVELTLSGLQSHKQHDLDTMVPDKQCNFIAGQTTDGESTRRYSMEEELMWSSKFPR